MKIEYTPIDLSQQKVVNHIEGFIELKENYFRFITKFHAEEPRIEDGDMFDTKEVYNDFDAIILKKYITAIEKIFTDSENWRINVCAQDISTVALYYKTHKQALEVYDKLQNWLLT